MGFVLLPIVEVIVGDNRALEPPTVVAAPPDIVIGERELDISESFMEVMVLGDCNSEIRLLSAD